MASTHVENAENAENADEAVPQLFYQAVQHVMRADITPMLALWSDQDDVTYIDPQGHHYLGHDSLVAYWQRAGELKAASQ